MVVAAPQIAAAGFEGEEIGGEDDHTLDWVVWSADNVADWVDSVLGAGFGAAFRLHEVDGPMLLGLTEAELREPLGLGDPMQRSKLLGHLRAFRSARARLARRAAGRRVAGESAKAQSPSPSGVGGGAQQAMRQAGRRGHSPVPQHFAPSPRTSQHPVTQGQLSRSQSAASTLSGGHSISISMSGAGSRFSKRLGTSKGSAAVCGSTLRLDSPSSSLRGTFGTTPKHPSCKPEDLMPGPCSYNVSEAEQSCGKSASPARATIGQSPRWSAELPPDCAGPGPYSYSVGSISEQGGSISKRQPPRATFGSSPRETSRLDMEELTPGPTSYNVSSLAFKPSSPRTVIGTSSRNTTEYIVSPGVSAANLSVSVGDDRGSSSPWVPSPRVKGGVIGFCGLSSRRPDPQNDLPGPCHYNVTATCSERVGPHTTMGKARRDTLEHFIKDSGEHRFQGPAATSPPRARGGVIGSAPRWREASPVGGSPRSPGSSTYKPRPAVLMNFR